MFVEFGFFLSKQVIYYRNCKEKIVEKSNEKDLWRPAEMCSLTKEQNDTMRIS